ncbi:hypothetical protein DPMN_127432 [Dreissena polymorpha]|uniref:Uncharacterized protein n=1 Tax=Dreissena polymorpha TaxID=45954 RepID=A0A9D4GZ81_DREPO|nr:hypothetical protein DPMN_127432 [Dreissena polymorpha]
MGVADSGLTGKPSAPGNLNSLRQQLHTAHTMSSSDMSPGPHSVTGQSSQRVYFGLSRRGRLTSLAGTCQQQSGQMEFFAVRDDSGFRLAAQCDKQQHGADNIMTLEQNLMRFLTRC